ncbi:MAG: hypothetical protein EPN20_08135, partial [Magnetospirillum sp.]
MTTRLLVGGLLLYAGLWWGLDIVHNREVASVVDRQLELRLGQKASRDSLRVDALLRSHRTFVSLLAESEGGRREAASLARDSAAGQRIIDGEPSWLSQFGDRQMFPPISMIVMTGGAGQSTRIWRVDGSAVPAGLEAALLLTPAADRAGIVLVNGVPMMVSIAAPATGSGGR